MNRARATLDLNPWLQIRFDPRDLVALNVRRRGRQSYSPGDQGDQHREQALGGES